VHLDWLTILAQIANFLVLIWLLQRFLYGPITRAMARREQRIAERLSEARAAREEAEAEARALREKREALKRDRKAAMEEARRKADALREELEADARARVEEERRAWLDQLEEDREELVGTLRKRVSAMAIETARRVLEEFADADLSARVAARFVERLGEIDQAERESLRAAAERAEEGALVESRFALPASLRGRITRAIHEHVADGIEVAYRDGADTMGVRLSVGGQIAEWSPERHLDRLGTRLDEALEAAAGAAARR
jgi:F-type H+-transporting ATPase subunit b